MNEMNGEKLAELLLVARITRKRYNDQMEALYEAMIGEYWPRQAWTETDEVEAWREEYRSYHIHTWPAWTNKMFDGYCPECEAKIKTAKNMDVVFICSKCVDVRSDDTYRILEIDR